MAEWLKTGGKLCTTSVRQSKRLSSGNNMLFAVIYNDFKIIRFRCPIIWLFSRVPYETCSLISTALAAMVRSPKPGWWPSSFLTTRTVEATCWINIVCATQMMVLKCWKPTWDNLLGFQRFPRWWLDETLAFPSIDATPGKLSWKTKLAGTEIKSDSKQPFFSGWKCIIDEEITL